MEIRDGRQQVQPQMTDRPDSSDFEVVVVGAGPNGLACALAMATAGRRVALVTGGKTARDDGRSVALMQEAIAFLSRTLPDVAWDELGTPLRAIRIIDATGALLRAPTVTFRAAEIDLPCFGYSIPVSRLASRLSQALEAAGVSVIDHAATTLDTAPDEARLQTTEGQTLAARLVVAADGANSQLRLQAGIEPRRWSYPQVALSFTVSHERDHDDISTEFHTREGPFTLVPQEGRSSSVVWMVSPLHARRLLALDDAAFARAAEERCASLLGRFTLGAGRGSFPMQGLLASHPVGARLALVGEAAHVFPPIGAQGLNLGLRDVAALQKATAHRADCGSPEALAAYAEARRSDLKGRTLAVDALNRSLLSAFLPVQMARGAGLALLQAVPPLRRAAMRLGMG